MRCNELNAINLLFSHSGDFCQLFYVANLGISMDDLPDAELMRGMLFLAVIDYVSSSYFFRFYYDFLRIING